MKTLMTTALAAALLVAAAPVVAGRDETLIRQIDHTMAAKHAAQQLASAQQQQQARTGLAGAVGQPGKVGPGTQPRRSGRAARQSLGDHP